MDGNLNERVYLDFQNISNFRKTFALHASKCSMYPNGFSRVIYFQQDGDSLHYYHDMINCMEEEFPEKCMANELTPCFPELMDLFYEGT